MRYQGGKVQLSKHIVPILEANRKPNQIYLEPFVGGASVVSQVSGTRIASDINSDVIAMWRAVQIGWNPPATVTEEEYENAKTDESIDPHLRAFIAVACSWVGKWLLIKLPYLRTQKNNAVRSY